MAFAFLAKGMTPIEEMAKKEKKAVQGNEIKREMMNKESKNNL